MVWFFKDKSKKESAPPAPEGKKLTREEILARAKAAASAARAEIGDETLEKIRQAMERKQNSDLEKAKNKVKASDKAMVADHLRAMIDEDK